MLFRLALNALDYGHCFDSPVVDVVYTFLCSVFQNQQFFQVIVCVRPCIAFVA